MSLSAIWDRFWWSLMLTILVGLVWLKWLDPVIPCVSIGILFAVVIGVTYFTIGIRAMLKRKKHEEEIEQQAYQELLADMAEESAQ
jgi:membrane protein YdbS with pleckstrin-like domain